MRRRVVRFEFQHFAVIHDCLIPGFGARKLQGTLAIIFGCLRKGDQACEEAERQESEKGSHTSESISGRAYKRARPACRGKLPVEFRANLPDARVARARYHAELTAAVRV